MNVRRVAQLVVLSGVLAAALTAQAPSRLIHANLQTEQATPNLSAALERISKSQPGPLWVGYSVPMIEGAHHVCCGAVYEGNEFCPPCQLEEEVASFGRGSAKSNADTNVRLESPRAVQVLFRLEKGDIQKIKAFSDECTIDAGGMPVEWLDGVSPAESVALLARYARADHADNDDGDNDSKHLSRAAVMAIAYHADASADAALESFVTRDQPESLRDQTAFWLGAAHGQRGYSILRRMMQQDPSPSVRKKAVFALSISKVPEALSTMISAARSDADPEVRGQALFWLAQKAGAKAAGAISAAIRDDPETEVKKKAVFALSQLPPAQGVPLLIEVARANRNPEVRQQAMFWLGQSHDSRALTFFEQVLASK
jgi:HEAT repeat protein